MMHKRDKRFYALFSLFHHDVTNSLRGESVLQESLIESLKGPVSTGVEEIGDVLIEIIREAVHGHADKDIGLTLTGGFDSRIILSILLHLNIKPVCYTYGNGQNKDILIAKNICRTFDLTHIHVVDSIPSDLDYLKNVEETIRIDLGKAHLHRAHRTAAARQISREHKPKVFFTGHLGGEQIRGLSYNDYFSSAIFQKYNENDEALEKLIPSILNEYFIRPDSYEVGTLIEELEKLSWMGKSKSMNQLYFIYDLIGFNHHQQDIRLFRTFFDRVVPVYLDERFIEVLMKSPHHFMRKTDAKLPFLSHPSLYCALLNRFCQPLMNIPLSNGYKPKDFSRGTIYYSAKRVWSKYLRKSTNPPSFSYGDWYVNFVKKNAALIHDDIWDIYDKENYFWALENKEHKSNEGYWHKFSNPIFFNLVLKLHT